MSTISHLHPDTLFSWRSQKSSMSVAGATNISGRQVSWIIEVADTLKQFWSSLLLSVRSCLALVTASEINQLDHALLPWVSAGVFRRLSGEEFGKINVSVLNGISLYALDAVLARFLSGALEEILESTAFAPHTILPNTNYASVFNALTPSLQRRLKASMINDLSVAEYRELDASVLNNTFGFVRASLTASVFNGLSPSALRGLKDSVLSDLLPAERDKIAGYAQLGLSPEAYDAVSNPVLNPISDSNFPVCDLKDLTELEIDFSEGAKSKGPDYIVSNLPLEDFR
jgi:hypothetical protein